ncbi:hypothetical protein [Anaerosporobacter sp.]|uniref:hypothetical protein n=1 Tax=Anaerosporobacter sp. TaxID=1872529 RepID=UPI00286F3CB1|nr:hypothetical protein [Anaerosporobacter sp.]
MQNISKIVKWKNGERTIDWFNVCCNAEEEMRITQYIVDALNNKFNEVYQKDWSSFGKDGDCITIEDVEVGGGIDGII